MIETDEALEPSKDPFSLFTEDIIYDQRSIPALEQPDKAPVLEVYAKGKGPGNPDIVTIRTEAYIIDWTERLHPIKSTAD
ncbi:MAG TPA: hypothetical protein VFQ54_09355 [Thermomicrobiales bacterium]|nr:hypothetical protein [Thermomicrobiales bacterium]